MQWHDGQAATSPARQLLFPQTRRTTNLASAEPTPQGRRQALMLSYFEFRAESQLQPHAADRGSYHVVGVGVPCTECYADH